MASHPDSFTGATSPSANLQQQHHTPTPQYRQQPSINLQYTDDDVRSNTLANSSQANPYYNDHSLAPPPTQQPANNGKFTEEWDASQRGSSIIDGHTSNMPRSNSFSSTAGDDQLNLPSRGNTLKKKSSLRRNGSLKRSGSRRSTTAGSVRSLALHSNSDPDDVHSVFYCPVPTEGNPTEVLANRFQTWRKILKDLIAYYREIQTHYETKGKSLLKLANVANNISNPPGFLASGGIDDAMDILRTYHKNSIVEANKAKEIEEDVILALTGLRSDLHQKIKEIKSLSGDFKNSVTKEMDATRKAVKTLQETIGQSDADPASTTGKQDPYLMRLAVDRQVERQIDEENYLHQAYLNLETSGRELEAIVVGEIQKAYNAYAGILKRESDAAYTAIDELRIGPISMPKDREWTHFVQREDHFVDPEIAVRSAEQMHYPGQSHESCQEIRAGLLERKSKYLKSYTAGWYVLSPTHLHEFKSADKAQAPVMSLYLPEQKLGSHSSEGGSSNKFILKGRQTGSMHRGHTWVFRAETHDTMMAWYEDIKALTEKTPQERSEFVRGHTRSLSQSSRRSVSSDGVVDEEDEEPFSTDTAVVETGSKQDIRRPQPGGRFPSDIQVNAQRGLQAPLSPSSVSSGFDNQGRDAAVVGAAGIASSNSRQGEGYFQSAEAPHHQQYGSTSQTNLDSPSHAAVVQQQAQQDGVNPYTNEPVQQQQYYTQPQSNLQQGQYQPDHYQQDQYQQGQYQQGQYQQDQYQRDQYAQQNVFVPVAAMQRSQSQRSQPPQDETRTPPVAPLVTDNTQHTEASRSGVLDTPGGNAQYAQWMNGTDQPKSHPQQGLANGEPYSSGQRSAGNVNVAPVFVPSGGFSRGADSAHAAPQELHADGSVPLPVQEQNYTTSSADAQQVDGSKVRPSVTNSRTISHLHIPGEYPKGTPTTETFGNTV